MKKKNEIRILIGICPYYDRKLSPTHPTHLYSRGSGFCLEVKRAWWTTCRPLLGVWEGRVIVGASNNVENLQKVTIFMIELARQ